MHILVGGVINMCSTKLPNKEDEKCIVVNVGQK